MSLTKVCDEGFAVTAPVCADGTLYVAAVQSGQLHRLDSGALVPVLETSGRPVGMAADPQTGDIFIADAARQALLKIATDDDGAPQLQEFLDKFEGKPFFGPHHVTFDAAGELLFTDSGSFGDTGLANPKGAVYRTIQGRQMVVQLAPSSLAYPTGVACCPRTGAVYVCECAANRLLRYVQHPKGVYHGSVFAQFQGGFGPMDVAVHPTTGAVFVAKFDFCPDADSGVPAPPGSIVVLSPQGAEEGTVSVPGPEITGLCFDVDGTLYVTERTAVYRMDAGAM